VRSFTTAGAPGRCQRCLILQAQCICAHLPTVKTKTEVVIVRHEREGWKSTGTARIAALAMPELRLLEFGEDAEPALSALPAEVSGAHLLFPGPDAQPLAAGAVTKLIVLDGTGGETGGMWARLPWLQAGPKGGLPPKQAKVLRRRESKFEEGRSTLEAIAEAIALLEGDEAAAPLHALHADYVQRVFKARGVWDQKVQEFEGG